MWWSLISGLLNASMSRKLQKEIIKVGIHLLKEIDLFELATPCDVVDGCELAEMAIPAETRCMCTYILTITSSVS